MMVIPLAHANAAPDDWSLERREDDASLARQRLNKLHKNPFDRTQWNALVRSVGLAGLGRMLDRCHGDSAPAQHVLLEARLALEHDDVNAALERLDALPSAVRLSDGAIHLRIDALERAQRHRDAVKVLEDAAQQASRASKRRYLEKAYTIAEQATLAADALRIAQSLERVTSTSSAALRVARAAHAQGDHGSADDAFTRAVSRARASERAQITAEQAQARLHAGNAQGAAALLWSLLRAPTTGTHQQRTSWWAQLWSAYEREHDGPTLIAELEPWLRSHPKEPAAWKTLAHAQHQAGQDATKAWRRAFELDPTDEESAIALIEQLEQHGQADEADALTVKLARHNIATLESALAIASRHIAAGNRSRGLRLATQIEQQLASDPKRHAQLIDFYNLNRELRKAIDIAKRMVEIRPRDPAIRIAYGEQLFQVGQVDEARKQWAWLPRLIHPTHRGLARHAQVLSEHGLLDAAVAEANRAIAKAPQHPEYLRLRATLAEEQDQPTQALELWQQVRRLAQGPEHRRLLDEARTRAVELLIDGAIPQRFVRVEEARQAAHAQLDTGRPLSEAVEAGRFLAELYTRSEHYTDAVTVLERLVELRPDDANQLEALAAAQRRAGHVDEALATMQTVTDIAPDREARVLSTMSELAFESGDSDRALQAALAAVQADRSNIDALIRLGFAHERRGDFNAAEVVYARALSIDARADQAKLRLAALHVTRGQTDQGRQLLWDIWQRWGSAPPDAVAGAADQLLDLAELTGTLDQVLERAIAPSLESPRARPPRELLIDALYRMQAKQREAWTTKATATERQAVSIALSTSLLRDSIGRQRRAAELLSAQPFGQTTEELTTLASTLMSPPDATMPIRNAHLETRYAALLAVGRSQDPTASPALAAIIHDHLQPIALRRVAAWSIATLRTDSGGLELAKHVTSDADPVIATIACVALAQRSSTISGSLETQIRRLARDASHPTRRHACMLAEAAVSEPRDAQRYRDMLDSTDAIAAAIAAWRLSLDPKPSADTWIALYRRLIGPPGLVRDAAGAALIRLVRGQSSLPPFWVPQPGETDFVQELSKYLVSFATPLSPSEVEPTRVHLLAALEANRRGTRAEQLGARNALHACFDANEICLQPFVNGPIQLSVNSGHN